MKRTQRSSKASSATIFVVVDVTYDYYRFQANVGATTDLEQARKIAAHYAQRDSLPIIEDGEVSKSMDDPESPHLWIERFPPQAISPAIPRDPRG